MTLSLFLPEIILSVLLAVLLGLTLLREDNRAEALLVPAALCGGALSFFAAAATLGIEGTLFAGTYRVDALSQGFKLMLSGAFIFSVLVSNHNAWIPKHHKVEFYFFLTCSLLGMVFITSAADLLTLYIAMELSAYSLYILSALKMDRRSAESVTKYLLMGAVASGVMLWGFSFVMGLSGTTRLVEIAVLAPQLVQQPLFMVAIFLIIGSFLFKLSAFPVHFWAPDVYMSSAIPVTTFIATASKAAAVALLIRVLMVSGISGSLASALGILAFFSMTLGNAAALVQQDVKRLLAYSSIAQAGYLLVGLMSDSYSGYSSAFFYAVAYVLMNAGAFLVVGLVANASNEDNPRFVHFNGLADRAPFLALLLLISLLSLAGIPPLVGFTGKWILFSAAMDKGHWFLVLWGVLNSVVSLFYYLTLVKHAYLEKPAVNTPLPIGPDAKILGLFLFIVIIALGLFPGALIDFAQNAIAAASV